MSAGARAVLGYALVGGVIVAAGAALLVGLVAPSGAAGIGLAAALAYGIQVASFAVLVGLRGRPAFFLAWGGGTLLRVGAVLGAGLWLGRTPHPPAPLLLSLAGFLFLLLLLEPAFFRKGLRTE